MYKLHEWKKRTCLGEWKIDTAAISLQLTVPKFSALVHDQHLRKELFNPCQATEIALEASIPEATASIFARMHKLKPSQSAYYTFFRIL